MAETNFFKARYDDRAGSVPQPVREARARVGYALMPCLALAAAAMTGALLWRYPELPVLGFGQIVGIVADGSGFARAGAGLVTGITLAHFWVDQFIWRSRSPERRGWLIEHYPFLAARI